MLLRAPSSSDVDAVFDIQGNADAMRFTYCAPSRADTAHYLASYSERFELDGFAPWIAIFKADQRIVGWGGLNRDPTAPHWGIEVAYFFHRSYWGRGLATELVGASLALAFGHLELPLVSAFTKPQNHASARVLCKAGFGYVRYVPELERDQYSLPERDWTARNRSLVPHRRTEGR